MCLIMNHMYHFAAPKCNRRVGTLDCFWVPTRLCESRKPRSLPWTLEPASVFRLALKSLEYFDFRCPLRHPLLFAGPEISALLCLGPEPSSRPTQGASFRNRGDY